MNHCSKVINCIIKGLCIKTLIHLNAILVVHRVYSERCRIQYCGLG